VFSLFKKFFFAQKKLGYTEEISCIVFGIGNTGKEYINTRHNVGFCVIDTLLKKFSIIKSGTWCKSEVFICPLKDGKKAALVKPQTFVNRSGFAIKELLKLYKIPLSSCLVVVDDFNLHLGVLRIRCEGTHGGHNGLLSIINEMGTDFPRVRIGIGPLPPGKNVKDFVLSSFEQQEIEEKSNAIKKAAEAVELFCEKGIEAAMNAYNSKKQEKKRAISDSK